MATFGTLRLICEQRFPGVPSELRDFYIQERRRLVLDSADWNPLHTHAVLNTVALVNAGTVAITAGSTAVVGTATAWTSAISGREFRGTGRSEFYGVTFVSGTALTLSRAWEGATVTALTYKIFERIFNLASDVDVLESIKRITGGGADMDQVSQERLDETAPSRPIFGPPNRYALHDYDETNDLATVELYPIPDTAWGIPYRYTKRPADFTLTSSPLESWMPAGLIIEGALADLAGPAGAPGAAAAHEVKFQALLGVLIRKESRRRAARPMQMPARHTLHRRRRGQHAGRPRWSP